MIGVKVFREVDLGNFQAIVMGGGQHPHFKKKGQYGVCINGIFFPKKTGGGEKLL